MARKHALVLVHGMGEQVEGWHTPAWDTLTAAFPTYAEFNGRKLADRVQPVPVLYSDFFTDLRQMWKDQVAQIKTVLGQQLDAVDTLQRQSVNNQIDSIANAIGAGADTFVWTHAMDVVLYRFFKLVRADINVKVGKQIAAATKNTFNGWSVIAHSLGTAVTHNTLHALYTSRLLADEPPLDPLETRPKVVAMVANVSRVLQLPALKVFSSKVMPGASDDGRVCDTYLNVRHLFDPFMFPQPFEPDNTWPPPGTFVPSQYQHIRPSHLDVEKLTNVHDLDHYLENPRVHVPIFRAIFGGDTIPDEELAAACAKFDQDIVNHELDTVRHALEGLIPAKTEEWPMILKSLFDLSGLVKP